MWLKIIDWLFPWCPTGMPHRIKIGVVKNAFGHDFCWHKDCMRANYKECFEKDRADSPDTVRLDWMLSTFYQSDGAWMASFCLHVHKGGIRAAIDAALLAPPADKTL